MIGKKERESKTVDNYLKGKKKKTKFLYPLS